MIKVIIAYDDNDGDLGDFFKDSYFDIKDTLMKILNINMSSVNGLDCTEEKIILETNSEDSNPFIFIGLSHGNESQLLTSNEVFVSSGNVSHFKKSLFYSPACRTALKLGVSLIENGCSTFIGCKQDTWVTFDDFHSVYIECDNYGIKEFLNSNDTIEDVFSNMLTFYDNKIDELFASNEDDVLLAVELQHNKDCFVLQGDKNLKKSDFEIQD